MRLRRQRLLRGRGSGWASRILLTPLQSPLKTDSLPAPPTPSLQNRPEPAGPVGHTPPSRPPQSAEERTRAPCLQVGLSSPCPSSAVFPSGIRLKLVSSWDHIPAGSFTLLSSLPF